MTFLENIQPFLVGAILIADTVHEEQLNTENAINTNWVSIACTNCSIALFIFYVFFFFAWSASVKLNSPIPILLHIVKWYSRFRVIDS